MLGKWQNQIKISSSMLERQTIEGKLHYGSVKMEIMVIEIHNLYYRLKYL